MRYSKPREIILEELKKVKTHPRGDELYQIVRRSLPNISLGTVYRNLNLLTQQRNVLELFAGDFNRYDGNTSDHSHFLCRECRRLWDFSMEPQEVDEKACELGEGFCIEGRHTVFHGLCPDCGKGLKGLSE
ncbi:MAG: transcriptional repressor [Dehalococcoidia bacterium]|nr:transcriptional repressor [Dehalococcoidia bacterium]MDZ4246587.1 transcriptional repressor [Dehalococcoidia bacterium]